MLNICGSHILYVLHLNSKCCSVEYWPLLDQSGYNLLEVIREGYCQEVGGLL